MRISAVVLGILFFWGQALGAAGRVVHFPNDRCLGRLMIQDADAEREIVSFHHWVDGTEWEYLGPARGDVRVPAGKRLWLNVRRGYWKDLSGLGNLRPDDLYKLSITGYSMDRERPDDRCMEHIAGLTGLRVLALNGSDISNKGLLNIRNMKHLERLYVPGGATSSGMRIVGRLKSLKGLYFKDTRVGTEGIKYLQGLTELEELDLGGKQIGDEALKYMAGFDNLYYLILWGGFTDAGMEYLKDSKSLRILNISSQIKDEGLKHLAEIDSLENLGMHWVEGITDAGMEHLVKAKLLKKLDIWHSKVTDKGLAILRGVKMLDYLDLPREGITNKGLKYLSELSNLRHLSLPRPCYVDPNMDAKPYTDEGLRHLSELSKLEELRIGGQGVTSAGMDYIAKLKKLKELNIFCCPIGDDGLAKLKSLESLEKIYLRKTGVTVSGLNQINSFKNLINLNVGGLIKKGAVLDISGLKKLEKLTIGTLYGSDELLDDADFACLSNLKRLESLQISAAVKDYADFSGLTDAGVAHLEGIVNLGVLTIGGRDLTDKTFSHLRNMKKLWMLNVYGGRFTNEGLKHLEKMKSLRNIRICTDSKFSDKALDELWHSLPNLGRLQVGPPGQ